VRRTLRTPPRKPSISWPERKIPPFRIGNRQCLIRYSRMDIAYPYAEAKGASFHDPGRNFYHNWHR
jgi:hypothetical protein